MEDKKKQAMELLLAKVRANSKPEDDLKYTQAALNLAHAMQILENLKK